MVFFRLNTLCSDRVSITDCLERQSVWKHWKMGDMSDFERGQIVRGVWLDKLWQKNCHIIRCIMSDSFWGCVDIHRSREDNIREEERWGKINTDRKRSSYIEECFEKPQKLLQHRWTSAKLNIHLEDLFPQKLYDVNFKNSTSTVGL
jgi:hypothetical protein